MRVWRACLWLGLLLPVVAGAALKIEITGGDEGALPVAVVPFPWTGGAKPPVDFSAIIAADLARSGRFEPLPEKDMLSKPSYTSQIRYHNWRILDIPYVVVGHLIKLPGGKLRAEVKLYDVFRGQLIGAYRLPDAPVVTGTLRMMAHRFSDKIYEALTGEAGAFATQVAYVKVEPRGKRNRYGLYVSHSDGAQEQAILRWRHSILSLAWAPDNRRLAFVGMPDGGPRIYLHDIYGDSQPKELLPKHRGKVSAPAWSPDGKKLAVAITDRYGNTDIYSLDVATKRLKRVTRHWGIDTEPTWAPDGKSIVFTSNRGGSGQIYQVDAEGRGRAKRLTFKGKENTRASFSPDGRMITFVHFQKDGSSQIAVLELDTGVQRILTRAEWGESERESPSFAPNGGMITYAGNYRKKGVLGMLSLVGGKHWRIYFDTGEEVREPAWSWFLNQ